jgi:glucose-6-phosphate dehydrogenase assembly protein OpcA
MVALHRRETAELLAEELRRLDPDEVYAETLRRLDARGIEIAPFEEPEPDERVLS